MSEVHSKESVDYDETSYTWTTRTDLYISKKAFQFPEVRAYCDKIIATAKSKKHPDPKFKNDPDMKLYKVLKENVEGRADKSGRLSSMTINSSVDKDAHASVIRSFATARTEAATSDDAGEKPAKKPRLSPEDHKMAKVRSDLAAATLVLSKLSDSPLVKPVKDDLTAQIELLKKLSHDVHEQALQDENPASRAELWSQIKTTCASLSRSIDIARSILYPGAFALYSTPYDAAFAA